MIQDTRRVCAYKEAIAISVKDLIVVDVGAGTGILTEAAVQSGASKVYAIEKSEIAMECCKMVKRNQYSDVVEIQNILAEEALIPSSSVDLIVSEWMGYFLLFERMLPSVLAVRDKCLKPKGTLIPGRGKIIIVAYSHLD
jgi:predicted RNA methylase